MGNSQGTKNRKLLAAIQRGKARTAFMLIKKGASVNATDEEGVSALHYAARAQSLEILEEMIHLHAYINCQTIKGETALHDAARLGFLQGCKLLLTHGAKLNMQTIVRVLLPICR